MEKNKHTEECPFCKGEGYVNIAVGGTESCPECHGDSFYMGVSSELDILKV
ncbi:YuiA family protein [Brevibacillus daliensis]|uniref:YuiA family protein n=1 Tax=Brevibacillus daliensis TaxID=2892995 RepID=UPI001E3EDAEF|nr:YuiA family protein [Brevibacillus daliensis]